MNLVRAELGRLAARRFVQLMVILLLGAFAITVATTLAGSHQPTGPEIATAQIEVARARAEVAESYARCQEAQRTKSSAEWGFPRDCDPLSPDRVRLEDYLWGVFIFKNQILPLTYFLITFLALFGFLVGASYIGADLNSGGMTNLLLWRPQRMMVLGTKLGTLLGTVLGLSVVAGALYLGGFRVIAEVSGLPGELDGPFWRDLALVSGRGLILVLLATTIGFALATLGRHTSAALGVIAAYTVTWELGARIVMEIVKTSRSEEFMLSTYLAAWISGEIQIWSRAGCDLGSCQEYLLTWVHGLAVLLAVAGALVGAAFVTFRRRDLA